MASIVAVVVEIIIVITLSVCTAFATGTIAGWTSFCCGRSGGCVGSSGRTYSVSFETSALNCSTVRETIAFSLWNLSLSTVVSVSWSSWGVAVKSSLKLTHICSTMGLCIHFLTSLRKMWCFEMIINPESTIWAGENGRPSNFPIYTKSWIAEKMMLIGSSIEYVMSSTMPYLARNCWGEIFM